MKTPVSRRLLRDERITAFQRVIGGLPRLLGGLEPRDQRVAFGLEPARGGARDVHFLPRGGELAPDPQRFAQQIDVTGIGTAELGFAAQQQRHRFQRFVGIAFRRRVLFEQSGQQDGIGGRDGRRDRYARRRAPAGAGEHVDQRLSRRVQPPGVDHEHTVGPARRRVEHGLRRLLPTPRQGVGRGVRAAAAGRLAGIEEGFPRRQIEHERARRRIRRQPRRQPGDFAGRRAERIGPGVAHGARLAGDEQERAAGAHLR